MVYLSFHFSMLLCVQGQLELLLTTRQRCVRKGVKSEGHKQKLIFTKISSN